MLLGEGNTNGTYLNGVRLTPGEHDLAPEDVVRCGRCLLVVEGDLTPLPLRPGFVPLAGMAGRFHIPRLIQELHVVEAVGRHVLISGESGVGKELAARVLHEIGRKRGHYPGKLVTHNCARFSSDEEAVANLFGVGAASFSGVCSRSGLLERARGGILFLDEVHVLPPRVQRSLLRFVEDGEFSRVGETGSQQLPVCLLLGTNLVIDEATKQGRLAYDLLNRLHIVTIPPLSSRRADIPDIFRKTIEVSVERMALHSTDTGLSPAAMLAAVHPDHLELLCLEDYANRNVRELVHIAETFAARAVVRPLVLPRAHLGALLAERFPHNPVVLRARDRRAAPGVQRSTWVEPPAAGIRLRRVPTGRLGSMDSGRLVSALAFEDTVDDVATEDPTNPGRVSHYERHRENIITAYHQCSENVSATERVLRQSGLKVSRRWLSEYLSRWGLR